MAKTHIGRSYLGRGGWRYMLKAKNGRVIFRTAEGYRNPEDGMLALTNACRAILNDTVAWEPIVRPKAKAKK